MHYYWKNGGKKKRNPPHTSLCGGFTLPLCQDQGSLQIDRRPSGWQLPAKQHWRMQYNLNEGERIFDYKFIQDVPSTRLLASARR